MSISSSINTLSLRGILKKTNPPIGEVQKKSETKINQFFGEKVDASAFSNSEVKTTKSFKKRFGDSFKRRLSKKASKEISTTSNQNSSTQSEDSKAKKSQKKVTFQVEKETNELPPGYLYMKPVAPSKPVPSSILVQQWIKEKDQHFRYNHSSYVYMSWTPGPVYQNLGSESFKKRDL